MSTRLRILIEGWRGVPHSYCVVTMNYARHLLDRADCDLRFADQPYFDPAWKPVRGVLAGDGDARVGALAAPEPGWEPSVVVRGDYPMRLDTHPAARVFCLGTTEFGIAIDGALSGGTLRERADGRRVSVVTPSRWSRDGYLRSGAPARGVHLVPLGVDTALFRPPTLEQRAAARTTLGIAADRFVFLSLGGMTDNKGVGNIIAGFGQRVLEDPRAALVLKGLSDMYASEARIRRHLEGLPAEAAALVERNLIYVGAAQSLDGVARLYHAADAYFAPYTAEGFCLPALEASACGLPVLCTRGGPTDEFLPRAGTIFIASDRKPFHNDARRIGHFPRPQALIDATRRVMADTGLREAALREGPANARRAYTWQHSTDHLVRVMRDGENGS